METTVSKTGYTSFNCDLFFDDPFGDLTIEQVKDLDLIFGGLIEEIYLSNSKCYSLEDLLADYSIRLDIDGFGEDDYYLFAIPDELNGCSIVRYFLLNAEFGFGDFYVYGGKEVYPAYNFKNGVLSFSAENLEKINKERSSCSKKENE